MAWWFGIKLWKRVFLGLVLGVIFGLVVSQTMEAGAAEALLLKTKVVGDVFIRLIRMIVVGTRFFASVPADGKNAVPTAPCGLLGWHRFDMQTLDIIADCVWAALVGGYNGIHI